MFFILNINSEASVKASIQMLGEDKSRSTWIFHSYFNLSWDSERKSLSHCGVGGIGSFESILTCPYFNSRHIINCHKEIEAYLNNGYSMILPISTEKIGIPGKNFYHNIFVRSQYNENELCVYDFWAPNFQWQQRIWEKRKIIEGISEIKDRKQYAIALKNNENSNDKYLELNLKDYINAYRIAGTNIGINVYEGITEWIKNIESIYFLDHVVFVTLEEHFLIWESIIKKECQEYRLVKEILSKARSVRNLSMKFWYSKRIDFEWKEVLIDKVSEIRQSEMEMLNKIEESVNLCI